ncbi:MAG: transglycosylase SLT domain-containing protein, partial [Campylobacteraceae bacterium]|nr:transglycosylase SLT domain-containing protein [Campylobacteraceae bacterium]
MNKSEQEKYANSFYTKQTLPHYTYLKEIASGYTKNFFITPYDKYLNGVDKKRKALIYSIARQESRFIPSAVSTSYALGLMQFMPFLAKATAKNMDMNG